MKNGIIMNDNGDPVHIRELMTLLDNWKKDILGEVRESNNKALSEIKEVNAQIDKRFDVHTIEHTREKDHRSSLIRWAVTSLISGAGVLLALYFSVKGAR